MELQASSSMESSLVELEQSYSLEATSSTVATGMEHHFPQLAEAGQAEAHLCAEDFLDFTRDASTALRSNCRAVIFVPELLGRTAPLMHY